jgi:hypothetical protein
MFKKLQPLTNKPVIKICTKSDLYCPKCKSVLFQNDTDYWCSDWDSQGGCGYKISKRNVTVK